MINYFRKILFYFILIGFFFSVDTLWAEVKIADFVKDTQGGIKAINDEIGVITQLATTVEDTLKQPQEIENMKTSGKLSDSMEKIYLKVKKDKQKILKGESLAAIRDIITASRNGFNDPNELIKGSEIQDELDDLITKINDELTK